FFCLLSDYPQTRFSTIVDHEATARQLSEAAVSAGVVVDTYIDLDIGMGRTGIGAGTAAEELFDRCRQLPGIAVGGFHAYDGQVREPDPVIRRHQCEENYRPVAAMVRQLAEHGH